MNRSKRMEIVFLHNASKKHTKHHHMRAPTNTPPTKQIESLNSAISTSKAIKRAINSKMVEVSPSVNNNVEKKICKGLPGIVVTLSNDEVAKSLCIPI